MALGNGLLTPTLSGMSSRHVHGRAQGRVLGLMAAAGSLGRFLGPRLAVLPLPATTPIAAAASSQILHGYTTAFTWSAMLVAFATVCLLLLRVPKDEAEATPGMAPVETAVATTLPHFLHLHLHHPQRARTFEERDRKMKMKKMRKSAQPPALVTRAASS